jgi:hypothetical protein
VENHNGFSDGNEQGNIEDNHKRFLKIVIEAKNN